MNEWMQINETRAEYITLKWAFFANFEEFFTPSEF